MSLNITFSSYNNVEGIYLNWLEKLDYIRSELKNNVLRLEYLKEDLVFNTTSHILKYIEKLIHTTKAEKIILDISAVDHIDSSAVGMFISVKHEMNKLHRSFMLTGVNDNVRRVLQILDITGFLDAA
jgi:anti-anti-sigma factor